MDLDRLLLQLNQLKADVRRLEAFRARVEPLLNELEALKTPPTIVSTDKDPDDDAVQTG